MLVPAAESGSGWLFWKDVAATPYFTLQQHKSEGKKLFKAFSSVRTVWDKKASQFRIVLNDRKHHILAIAESKEEIEKDYKYLQRLVAQSEAQWQIGRETEWILQSYLRPQAPPPLAPASPTTATPATARTATATSAAVTGGAIAQSAQGGSQHDRDSDSDDSDWNAVLGEGGPETTTSAARAIATQDEKTTIFALWICALRSQQNSIREPGFEDAFLRKLFPLLNVSEVEARSMGSQKYDVGALRAKLSNELVCQQLVLDALVVEVNDGVYDARSREVLRAMTSILRMPWHMVEKAEDSLADALRRRLEGEASEEAKKSSASKGRGWKIGLAAVGGGAALLLTGGLAAPLVGMAIGTTLTVAGAGGIATTASVFGMMATPAVLGGVGAKLASDSVDRRTAGLDEFGFEPVQGSGMHVVITVSGWLGKVSNRITGDEASNDDTATATDSTGTQPYATTQSDDSSVVQAVNAPLIQADQSGGYRIHGDEVFDTFVSDWSAYHATERHGEHYTIRWESQVLLDLGEAFSNFIKDTVKSTIGFEIAKRTILGVAALPVTILGWATLIDNPFHMATDRALKAGKLLAQHLMSAVHGKRPVSLIGYSVGARLIFACLQELAEHNRHGIIHDVVLLGTPVEKSRDNWEAARRVVSGRLVNGYCTKDWVLTLVYRAAHASLDVAGLGPVNVKGVENVDLTDLVSGHLVYKAKLPDILSLIKLLPPEDDILGDEESGDVVTANTTTTTTTTTTSDITTTNNETVVDGGVEDEPVGNAVQGSTTDDAPLNFGADGNRA